MAQGSDHTENQGASTPFAGYLQLVLIVAVIIVALIFARAPSQIGQDFGTVSEVQVISPVVEVIRPAATSFALPVKLTGNVTLQDRVFIISEARGRVLWVSEKLVGGGVISANEVFLRIDPAEYQLRVDEAQARLDLAKLKGSDSEADVLRVELLQTRLELAKLKLAQTELSLPYAIRVTRAGVEVGELVGPVDYMGREAAVLAVGYRPEALQVSASIEPELLEKIDPLIGASATVTVGEKRFEAAIKRVSSLVKPETRLIPIFLELPDEAINDTFLFPGMFAEIVLDGPNYDNVFVLPHSAVQSSNKVWVVKNGSLSSYVPDSIGYSDSDWAVESFDTADGIVIGPVPGATEGYAVQIAN